MSTSAPGSRAPLIVGFLLGGALLLAIAMFADSRRGSEPAGTPPLVIVRPVNNDTVDAGALVVRFRTAAPLRLEPNGWLADGMHPHVLLDGQEIMAGSQDISAAEDGFIWQLPPVQPGRHALYLTWAGAHHGLASDTAGQAVIFFTR